MRCRPASSLSRPLFFRRGSVPFSTLLSPVKPWPGEVGFGVAAVPSWVVSRSAMAAIRCKLKAKRRRPKLRLQDLGVWDGQRRGFKKRPQLKHAQTKCARGFLHLSQLWLGIGVPEGGGWRCQGDPRVRSMVGCGVGLRQATEARTRGGVGRFSRQRRGAPARTAGRDQAIS